MRKRLTRYAGIVGAAGIALVAGFTSTGMALAATAAKTVPAKSVTYLGHQFQIPASWRVISLRAHPRDCVRFDVHLGTPGADENCPASRVAPRTEALLVQPAPRGTTGSRTYRDSAAHQYVATDAAAGLTATGTYGSAPGVITAILSSAGLLRGTVRPVPPAAKP